MRSTMGFMVVSVVWYIYIRGAYGGCDNTTRTGAETYEITKEATHQISDGYKKHKQNHPRMIDSNESR